MKLPVRSRSLGLILPALAVLSLSVTTAHAEGGGVAEIKGYLTGKLSRMDGAAHDFVKNAADYEGIVNACGGDYNRVAVERGSEALGLVRKMQDDFKVYHNDGYETIEGITAGTKLMVDFDNFLDAGVPKGEATTDTPASALVLKDRNGKVIVDRQGNLFHYVIEPTLWGTKEAFVHRLSPEAAAKVKPVTVLPRADVLVSASAECARKMDELQGIANRWNPTLDECVGALVWMTPTLNGYFDDWRESRYNPQSSIGRYVAESRVLDMRGIMFSLQLMCNAILPELAKKDAALAARLKGEYADILNFVNRVDARERASGSKMTAAEIEELAVQAKRHTDQLTPHLKQMAAEMNLKLPPKPTLA